MIVHSLNFEDSIERMEQASRDGTVRPTIIGGRFESDRLDDFLSTWRLEERNMPWRIWEHISKIEFASESGNTAYLQRAEVFGEGGHLSLRRDGSYCYWHYIGPHGQLPPQGFDQSPECEDYWKDNQSAKLRRYQEVVTLWGEEIVDEQKEPTGRWWEDRVAAAGLEYPPQLSGNPRVYLTFWRYTDGGQTAFVWYRALGNAIA